jgi:hypothetical protein
MRLALAMSEGLPCCRLPAVLRQAPYVRSLHALWAVRCVTNRRHRMRFVRKDVDPVHNTPSDYSGRVGDTPPDGKPAASSKTLRLVKIKWFVDTNGFTDHEARPSCSMRSCTGRLPLVTVVKGGFNLHKLDFNLQWP